MDSLYAPTPAEHAIAASIHNLVNDMMSGRIDGIAVCAVDKDGEPAFFYLNKPDGPVLRPALNKLHGLYEANRRMTERMNAPKTNRSYLEH